MRGRTDGSEVARMTGKVGDRIIVESEKVGQPARAGDILEVIDSTFGTGYRVRWDDGHESTFRPKAGSALTTRPEEPRPTRK